MDLLLSLKQQKFVTDGFTIKLALVHYCISICKSTVVSVLNKIAWFYE